MRTVVATNKANFLYTIDMDDVIRLVYTQLPRMRANKEKTRTAYIYCRMYPNFCSKSKKLKRRKGRFLRRLLRKR